MVDAQNERTKGRNRRRGRRQNRGQKPVEAEVQHRTSPPQPDAAPTQTRPPNPDPVAAPFVRPADLAAPTVRTEEYCTHHKASFTEREPAQIRTNMTTVRHLQVDHFGESTLYCDCLHSGPHEWPPAMQRLQTAVELDQFLTDSTSEA